MAQRFFVNVTSISSVTDVYEERFHGYLVAKILIYGYNTIFIPAAFIGNLFLLYIVTKYNLVNSDSFCTKVLGNVAAADFIMTILVFLPKLVTTYAKRWVLGVALCYALASLSQLAGIVEIMLLAILSTYKFITLLNPFRAAVNKVVSMVVIGLVWIVGLINAIVQICPPINMAAYFDPGTFSCEATYFWSRENAMYQMVTLALFLIIPMAMIIISNIGMITVAALHTLRHDNRLPSLSVTLTIVLVCVVFIASWTPLLALVVIQVAGKTVPFWYNQFQADMMLISCLANPLIYTATLRGFRKYVMRTIYSIRTSSDYAT